MKVCGPKLSLCGLIISVWGIIQLVFMGIFYQVKSVALAEDLPHIHEATFATVEEFYTEADKGYSLNAYNCWIAACLYVFTLIISGHQFYVNSRSSLSM
ncbi:ribonuclease kappa-B [Macrosteles quadrilineatus]|uniref:ribonuclease kappa-B n=1 Tax=Macrosteles quadrilineatus TaxID=74068 RepID=UPI0023E13EFF|nr:ribonuclease kappa-B [Macrosteles quadrilineatus]